MKAALITEDPFFPTALSTLIKPLGWEIKVAPDLSQLLATITPGVCTCAFVHGRVIDARLISVVADAVQQGFRTTFVVVEDAADEWEERAYTTGAAFVFILPLRAPMLFGQISKLLPSALPLQLPLAGIGLGGGSSERPAPATTNPSELAIIRDFGRLLRHTNDADSFVAAYIEHLREVLSVNRVALYVTDPTGPRLTCAFTAGIDAQIARSVNLSLEVGIGAFARAQSLVISTDGPLPLHPSIRREMDAIGASVAIPVRTRDQFLGVLLVGRRLLGEPLGREHIDILYLLMEDLALVLRNAKLHDDLSRERAFFSSVLEQMGTGLLVFDRELKVVHVNRTMAACFGIADPAKLSFHGLPNQLSALIYSVVRGQTARAEFAHVSGEASPSQYHITIEPFQNGGLGKAAVLLLAHNHTQLLAQRQAAVDQARNMIIGKIGAQFSHVFNNSLTPLATFAQLLPARADSPNAMDGMQKLLPPAIARLRRHIDEIYNYSRSDIPIAETVAIPTLIQEAWSKATIAIALDDALVGAEPGRRFNLVMPVEPAGFLRAARAGMVTAFFEGFINAMEADEAGTDILVTIDQSHPGKITIGVHDSGKPITPEVLSHVGEPLFTTKNTGLGLGLCVILRVMRENNSSFAIAPSQRTKGTVASFTLPLIQ